MTKHPLHWLPNALTILRPVLSLLIAWMIIRIAVFERVHSGMAMPAEMLDVSVQFRQFWGQTAFITFCIAAATDWLDGYLARLWNAETRFGRLLDPIADKFVVNLPLLAIAWASGWALPVTLPVVIILVRDAVITGLRFAGLGAGRMAVSLTAKIKTFLEMVLLALFLASVAMLPPYSDWTKALMTSWLFGLWGVACLSAWTGCVYALRLVRPDPAPRAEH